MLFADPDPDTLYAALLARDPSWDGRAFVGVSTTGVFCRLTCPARKPKRAHCQFFPDTGACVAAGFRPCHRCHPVSGAPPFVTELLAALNADPERRWSEEDLHARGYDPSTVRRGFKRAFGQTFLDLARARRLKSGLSTLKTGDVIEAQLDAGFGSDAGFRAAVARLLGVAPAALRQGGLLHVAWIETPLGDMIAVTDQRTLHLLEFADRPALPREMARLVKQAKGGIGLGETPVTDALRRTLDQFFAGENARFEIPLVLHGTPFTQSVWRALQEIPAGETRSYSDLAAAIGRPDAVRAVARANGANQIAILIPCHRVLGADGALTGYGGGLWRKDRLIRLEKQYEKDKIR